MRLLLDENLPKRLKSELLPHEALIVRDMGWNGMTNGALLAPLKEHGFQALLTFDKNLQFQQNFRTYDVPVIILDANDNTYTTLSKLVPRILELLGAGVSAGVRVVR